MVQLYLVCSNHMNVSVTSDRGARWGGGEAIELP